MTKNRPGDDEQTRQRETRLRETRQRKTRQRKTRQRAQGDEGHLSPIASPPQRGLTRRY